MWLDARYEKTRVDGQVRDVAVLMAADIRAVFNARDRHEAESLLANAVQKYASTASALADWMVENIPEGLTVFAFPEKHQRRLRTTNGLERLNREIRHHTRAAVLFPNPASYLRLVTANLGNSQQITANSQQSTGNCWRD